MMILSRSLLALLSLAPVLYAAPLPESLLPPFGSEGAEFSHEGKEGGAVRGWLPENWVDNSEWTTATATYERLVDRPDDAAGAVRIKIAKVGQDEQVQFTSYQGERTYEAGKRYRICGWLRSPEEAKVYVGVRQGEEPYQAYFEGEVAAGKQWKPFEFNFQPEQDTKALIILGTQQAGTLDVAGVTVATGGVGPSLFPTFGTEGQEINKPSAKGHLVKGWLPANWEDNSEWAPVDATYSRLEDTPPETLVGLRMQVETVKDANSGDEGQLQLTTYNGPATFAADHTYQVTGWVRSEKGTPLNLDVRMQEEPWTKYHEVELATGAEWKPFRFTFRPQKDISAHFMMCINQPGTVDVAGVVLAEVPGAK